MIKYKLKKNKTVQDAFKQVYEIITLLRSPEGCPWDRKQTQETTAASMMNEVYEFIDEVNKNNKDGMKEELGDVMLNMVLLLIISSQDKGVDTVSVLDALSEKLIRRHPHVFGEVNARSADEALGVWNEQKKKEGKVAGDDFFERIPKSKSVFERAEEVHQRVRKVGFDWDDANGVYAKLEEELSEVKHARDSESKENLRMELGDLIFAAMAVATNLGENPSQCLHLSLEKFEHRFNKVRHLAEERGVEMKKGNIAEMDRLWDEVKSRES